MRARHIEAYEYSEKIVMPLRNPYDVYLSWAKENRDQNFLEKWHDFNEICQTNDDIFILPIDTLDRDEKLKDLSTFLDVELKTDWTPVNRGKPGEMVKTSERYTNLNYSSVYNLPTVKQFYNINSLSRKEAEKIVRQVIQSHAGEKLAPNLFNESVNQLMEQANG